MDTDDLKLRRWGEISDGYLGPAFHMRFQPGHVLYGSRRTYLRKVAVADFAGICANTTFVLESKDPNVLLPELLPFIMQTEAFHEHSVKQSKGSVNPYVNFSDLAWYEFALPPLDEQRRLAQLMYLFEEVVEGYQMALEAINRVVISVHVSEFSPEQNPARRLADFCRQGKGIQIGPFGAQLHQYDYTEHGVPVVMPANIVNDAIDTTNIARIPERKAQELSMHRLIPGDILLPRRGDLDKRAFIGEEHSGWLCGTGSLRIRVDETIPAKAVFYALSSPHAVRWLVANAVGTTMPNLNSGIVSNIPIVLPPQSRIETVVECLDGLTSQIGVLRQRQADINVLKKSTLTTVI
jgi:type I restriction enzyme S subunit